MGLPLDRCPECGTPFDPTDSTTWASTFFQRQYRRVARVGFKLLLFNLLILPVEYVCALYAYESVSEIHSFLLQFIVIVGNGFFLLLLFVAPPRVVVFLQVVLALLIVPRICMHGVRHHMLAAESEQLIEFLEQHKQDNGEYPSDLSGYQFLHQSNKPHFQLYESSDFYGGFRFLWYISNHGTSHTYCPKRGWSYYPD